MSSLHAIFVLPHIWVAAIYAVNVVAAVLVCVDIYVDLLTHILAWRYPMFIYVITLQCDAAI